ncbi:uncharacterized protein AB675_4652 [Cyphellophora attinorum]|uniref:Zn(2)-C6 fungal-type domain-containing protein n=1 Tax=Cyphellophora attinorum TaxID=1664694 RepID=A0A0N0NLD4_9EURO|nr:uncharacterized protein AB675_4652 [Phialophora attinorum]KPI39048.1 hypothetical protein AB675_4652 [Phialophora attinorum]
MSAQGRHKEARGLSATRLSIKCDLRIPTCLNCDRSRQYYCEGYPDKQTALFQYSDGLTQLPHASFNDVSLDQLVGPEITFNIPPRPEADYDISIDGLPSSQWPDVSFPPNYASEQTGLVEGNPVWTPGSLFQAPMTTAESDTMVEFFDAATSKRIAMEYDRPTNLRRGPNLQSFHPPSLAFSPELDKSLSVQSSRMAPRIASRDTRVSSPFAQGNDPRIIEDLLHHYKTHVSQLMMPTSAPSQNPYLCVYLPMALQNPSGDAKESLLMAILAVAAFNKAELKTSEAKRYRTYATNFAERAASILQSFTGASQRQGPGSLDEADRKALLAAVVTMNTVEIFSGGQHGKGYECLLWGKRIISMTGGLECRTHIWLEAPESLPDVAPNPWLTPTTTRTGDAAHDSDELAATISPSPVGQYTLDVSFGVARKTLECLNKTIDLANQRETHQDPEHKWRWPDHTHSALRQLESEIFDIIGDPNALDGEGASNLLAQEGISDYINEEVKENHVWSFHYSAALFFRRAICGGSPSVAAMLGDDDSTRETADRLSGQELVAKALDHLENIDVLSGDAVVANTLWPAFIAAVEAVHTPLRHRALIWFVRAKRHGIGNITKAKALAMEIWRQVDRQSWVRAEKNKHNGELSCVDWRKVMQEKGMYIMLT